jgi:hypothetical protein
MACRKFDQSRQTVDRQGRINGGVVRQNGKIGETAGSAIMPISIGFSDDLAHYSQRVGRVKTTPCRSLAPLMDTAHRQVRCYSAIIFLGDRYNFAT